MGLTDIWTPLYILLAVIYYIRLKVSKRDRWGSFLCLGLAHAIFLKCTQALEITTGFLNGKQNVWVFGLGRRGRETQSNIRQ